MKDEVFALCVSVIFIELGLCWAFAMFADYTGDSIGKMENDPDRVHGTHPRKHLSSNIYYYSDAFKPFFLVILNNYYGQERRHLRPTLDKNKQNVFEKLSLNPKQKCSIQAKHVYSDIRSFIYVS